MIHWTIQLKGNPADPAGWPRWSVHYQGRRLMLVAMVPAEARALAAAALGCAESEVAIELMKEKRRRPSPPVVIGQTAFTFLQADNEDPLGG